MKLFLEKMFWMGTVMVLAVFLLTSCTYLQKESTVTSSKEPVAHKKSEIVVKDIESPWIGKFETPKETVPFVHTVRWKGESLSYISKWYTGDYSNWRRLARANPGIKPNLIHKGNEIVIPKDILKTQAPLPKDFMTKLAMKNASKGKAVQKKSTSKQTEEEENPLPLFGPK